MHSGDMTSRLEALHGSAIQLEVLKSEHSVDALYSREVLLRSALSGRAVEYGAIQIFLNAFEPSVRARILEGRIPLGGILNSSGMLYYSEPQAFFFVQKGRRLAGLLEVESSARLYGRCNVLRGGGGEMLARIVEVVPPLPLRSAEAQPLNSSGSYDVTGPVDGPSGFASQSALNAHLPFQSSAL